VSADQIFIELKVEALQYYLSVLNMLCMT